MVGVRRKRRLASAGALFALVIDDGLGMDNDAGGRCHWHDNLRPLFDGGSQAKTLALLTHRREALEHVRFAIWDIVHEDHIDSRTVAELTEAYRLSKLVFSKGVSGSLEKLHGIAFRLQGIPLLERTTQDQKDRDFLAGQIQKTLRDMESESAA